MSRRRGPFWTLAAMLLLLLALEAFSWTAPTRASMGEDLTYDIEPGDIYIMIADHPIWMGNRIRYTVFETCNVEARFITMAGEIIIILPMGEQAPGQYTLPWHKTPEAASMAGYYKFELYFDDEYGANFEIAVMAPPSLSS